MPLLHTLLPGRRAIFIRATGTVTLEEHEQLVAELMNEPALEEGLPVLIDARGAAASIRPADLPHVLTLTRMLVKRGMDIIAIVTEPGPVRTLARAFELAARAVGVHVNVFDDVVPARVWLQLPAEDE